MRILSLASLLLFTFLLCGVQTTLWTQFFSGIVAPLLWLNLVVYLTIERTTFTALAQIYCVAVVVSTFTVMPLGILFFTLFILFWIMHFVRTRIYWSGSLYFAFMCFIGIGCYHVAYIFTSFIFENNSTGLLFFDRFVQILLTPLFSFWMFSALKKLDFWLRVTNPELEGLDS